MWNLPTPCQFDWLGGTTDFPEFKEQSSDHLWQKAVDRVFFSNKETED